MIIQIGNDITISYLSSLHNTILRAAPIHMYSRLLFCLLLSILGKFYFLDVYKSTFIKGWAMVGVVPTSSMTAGIHVPMPPYRYVTKNIFASHEKYAEQLNIYQDSLLLQTIRIIDEQHVHTASPIQANLYIHNTGHASDLFLVLDPSTAKYTLSSQELTIFEQNGRIRTFQCNFSWDKYFQLSVFLLLLTKLSITAPKILIIAELSNFQKYFFSYKNAMTAIQLLFPFLFYFDIFNQVSKVQYIVTVGILFAIMVDIYISLTFSRCQAFFFFVFLLVNWLAMPLLDFKSLVVIYSLLPLAQVVVNTLSGRKKMWEWNWLIYIDNMITFVLANLQYNVIYIFQKEHKCVYIVSLCFIAAGFLLMEVQRILGPFFYCHSLRSQWVIQDGNILWKLYENELAFCPVCQNIVQGPKIVIKAVCLHKFHEECFQKLLNSPNTPNSRYNPYFVYAPNNTDITDKICPLDKIILPQTINRKYWCI